MLQVSKFFIAQGQPGRRVMGVMNCFAGGVFFGSYLLHMAPEVRMLLEASWLKPKNIIYPFPELFMGLGFFMVLYLEKFCKAVNDSDITLPQVPDDDIEINQKRIGKQKRKYLKPNRSHFSCLKGEKECEEVHSNKYVSKKTTQFLCVMCHKSSIQEDEKIETINNEGSIVQAKQMSPKENSTKEETICEIPSDVQHEDIMEVPSLSAPKENVTGNAIIDERMKRMETAIIEFQGKSDKEYNCEHDPRDSKEGKKC